MHDVLIRYFAAEKGESTLFIAIGVAAIAISVYLLVTASSWRTAAYPLLLVALIQIVTGAAVFLRTGTQVRSLAAQLAEEPRSYRRAELPRMERVMASFRTYRWTEIALLLLGIAVALVRRDDRTWMPAGTALAAQAAITLLLDYFAERRGAAYLAAIRKLV